MKEQVSTITEQENVSEDQLKSHVEANKDQFQKALEYLSKNSEQMKGKAVVDPLSDVLRLGKEELASAYDRLIQALGDREKAIEARLRKSIQHYGL